MNKYILILLIIIISLSLCSCWNYNELDSFYIVAGIAVDKNTQTDLYNVSVEVINMKDTDVEPNIESQIIQSSGDSIFDAVREMIKVSSKKLYWSHATTLILSEDVAKDSIIPVLDWVA